MGGEEGSAAGEARGMRGAAIVVAISLLAGALATLPAAAQQEPHVTDPAGDAREYNSEMATAIVRRNGCRAIYPATHLACAEGSEAMPAQGSTGLVGGTPAPPALDAVAAWFSETPTHLLVHMQVAGLAESLEGLREDNALGRKTGGLSVIWGDPSCPEEVEFFPDNTDGGADRVLATFYRMLDCTDDPDHAWGGGCNAWAECAASVEVEVAFGAPATITWRVPRAILLHGEAGDVLRDPYLMTNRVDTDTLRSSASTTVPGGSDVRRAGVSGTTLTSYYTDLSAAGRAFTFTLPRAEIPVAEGGRHWVDSNASNAEARADILWTQVEETPQRIDISVGVAQVDETPSDAWLYGAFGLPSGHVVEFAVDARGEDGGWGSVGWYAMPYGDRPYLAYSVLVPLEVEVVPGTPGEFRVSLDRSTLPLIEAGGYTKVIEITPGVRGEAPPTVRGPARDPVDPQVSLWQVGDVRGAWEYTVQPPYRFRFDTPREALDGIVRLQDPVQDAQLPELALRAGANPDQFDITYVEGRGAAEDALDLTIGIRDLSTVAVPMGYHAVFYAFGVETAAGSYMVGYHKDEENPAGTFLCAQDTTVLAEAPRDPTQGVWTLLTGLVTTAASADGSGSGGPGSITIHLPYECVGARAGEDVAFRRFDAATYLVQNPTGRNAQGSVVLVDESRSSSPVVVPLAREVAPEATLWDRVATPYGVQNFWDMLGIAVAVAVTAGGAGVKLRQRAKDKRVLAAAKAREDRDVYRAALQRVVASGAADPAQDEVLAALRRRLGISEREHARYEMEARAGLGIAGGRLAAGELFLGRYRIERSLGEGGFARTFLATDERLSRRVVLKAARLDSAEEAKRAQREARVLAKMDHPRIVAIHDVEEVGGEVVLVLEHMSQGSLADKLRSGPLPTAQALAVADDVLTALEAAHAQGVVHRDVKPANVLLTADGRAKLADFGIARGGGEDTATEGSMLGDGAGSIACMAPEQARGVAVDERSDLYAVGALLYHALAGRTYLPFDRLSPFDARIAIVEDAPDLPLPSVPPELNELLARALAKDAADRPQSAVEMRRALSRIPG